MKGKVIMITGATSGIGHATALLFAQHGVKVVAVGRNEKVGNLLVEEISDKGGEALFLKADISEAKAVKSLVETTQKHFGRLDYALNNAGIEGTLISLADVKEEEWDALMNTNLKGLWLCMKYEIPAMIQNGAGVIINISTNLTKLSEPTTSMYTASKAAVEALTRIAAVEYGPYGIRINAINPGAVETPMIRRIFSDEMLMELKEKNPLKKIAEPQDIAEAVLWTCSPKAKHINGTLFTIDGGS